MQPLAGGIGYQLLSIQKQILFCAIGRQVGPRTVLLRLKGKLERPWSMGKILKFDRQETKVGAARELRNRSYDVES